MPQVSFIPLTSGARGGVSPSLCRRAQRWASASSDSFLDQIEDPAELTRWAAGGEVKHEAVVGQLEELGEHLDRDVVAQHTGVTLALQAVAGGVGDGRGPLGPPLGERRI